MIVKHFSRKIPRKTIQHHKTHQFFQIYYTPLQISKKIWKPRSRFQIHIDQIQLANLEVDQVAKLRIKSFGPRCFRKTWDAIWDALTNGHIGAGIFADSVQEDYESKIETDHLLK